MPSLGHLALLVSIAAIGTKTTLKRIYDVGSQAIAPIVAEPLFVAVFVLAGVAQLAVNARPLRRAHARDPCQARPTP